MIEVYATAGTFPDRRQLAADLAAAVMAVEQTGDPRLKSSPAGSGFCAPGRRCSQFADTASARPL
jgi:hypothetical protein